MKKIVIILMIAFASLQMVIGQQAPGIEWQNTIGGSDLDYLYSIQQTVDGGYILGGLSGSDISGDKTENCIGHSDYWIVKTDGTGNVVWENTIGGVNYDGLFSIQQTSDGGYILGGYSDSNISGDKNENNQGSYDYWVLKLDSFGNIIWQNTIGGNGSDELTGIKQTLDGGFICVGYSNSGSSGDKTDNSLGGYDYWILKLDSNGNIQWQKTIGGSDADLLFSFDQTADGGYILGGYSWSNISGNKTENNIGYGDYWIVKVDSSGNVQWDNTIGGNHRDELHCLHQTTDGGYILGGYSTSNISGDKNENIIGSHDYWIVKIDSSGNLQWQNTIGAGGGDALQSLQQTNDGGYILGGISGSNSFGDKTENSMGYDDYWIVKTDLTGTIQWENTIGGNKNDYLFSVKQTLDGGYIISGFSWSNISGDKTENSIGGTLYGDYWIVKLYPDTITSINTIEQSTNNVQVFPNPFTEELAVYSLQFPVQLKMFDVMGKEIMSQQLTTVNSKLKTGNIPKGVYFLKLNVDGNVVTKKVIKM